MSSKQLKGGIILSYISMFANMIIQLVYTPVMIRLLGQSEYGLYTLVGSVVSYLSLFSLGFTGAYLRYYSFHAEKGDKQGEKQLNGMFLSLFLCMGVIALICGITLAQFTPQIFGDKLTYNELKRTKILMEILVVNIALSFPASIFDSIISAHEQFIFQRLITLLGTVFNPIICLPLLLMGYESIAVVAVTTLITILKLITSVVFGIKKLHIAFAFNGFDFKLLREIAGFSFFIFINMIIDQVNWSIDKFILGRVSGTKEVAVYGVATQFNTIFTSMASTISSVFAPRVNKIVANSRSDTNDLLSNLLVKVGRLQYMIIVYIGIGFVFCGRTFITWWAGAEYQRSYYVALLLILPLILVLPHNLGIEIRRAKNKHRIVSIIMLVTTVMNLLISIPLAKRWGAIGSAAGTFLSIISNLLIIDLYYIRAVGLDMVRLFKNIGKISLVILVPVLFGIIGIRFDDLKYCFGWAAIYSVLYWFFMYRYGMNNEEKNYFIRPLQKICKMIRSNKDAR